MSEKKTLLLNQDYQVNRFICYNKAFKYLFCGKDKVEVISNWDDVFTWENGSIQLPSILRLKHYVSKGYFNSNFSRSALVKRDKSTCQFCLVKLSAAEITIDHLVPKAQGGRNSFMNCVVCCKFCNNKKADRTPEQAGMVLSREPTLPSFSSKSYVIDNQQYWHNEWNNYLITG